MLRLVREYSPYLLLLVILTAFVVRFWWLDQSPRGLLIDEAHFGYIAHSLNETGRDEHGVSYPLVFKGFGDQKLPVQAYLLMPVIKLLGLNAIAVRLPSVIAGTLLVLVVYKLLKELGSRTELALLGGVLTALSPWTFMLSRFAYEANLALLFFTLGLVAWLKLDKTQHWKWALISAVLMAATWYTYVAFRPVTMLLSLLFFGWQLVKEKISWQPVVLFGLVFSLMVAPLFHPRLLSTGAARFNQIGILSDEGVVLQINQNRTFCDERLSRFFCYALWNKPLAYGREIVQRYLNVYSFEFMFTQGDEKLIYQSVEDYGQFYLLLAPLMLLGIVSLVFRARAVEIDESHRWLLLAGLVVAPVSSVLAGQAQMVRLSPLIPFTLVLIVFGLELLWDFLPNKLWPNLAYGAICLYLVVASTIFMTNFYTVHTSSHDLVYQSYLPELFSGLAELPPEAGIYIKPFFSDPIMAYAFYEQISPAYYQDNAQLGELESSGFQHAVGLDRHQVSEEPMVNLGCRALQEDRQAYYVTNEYFERPRIDYVFRVASENEALYYAYVYDASGYAASRQDELCLD